MKYLFGPPLARAKDPITSHKAAEKMVVSGALNKQEKEVYDAISRYATMFPDFTTKDIAIIMLSMPYWKAYDICHKRFSSIERKGKIELTGDRRDGCRVWRLK